MLPGLTIIQILLLQKTVSDRLNAMYKYRFPLSNLQLSIFQRGSDEAIVDNIDVDVVAHLLIYVLGFLGKLRPKRLTVRSSVTSPYISVKQIHVEAYPDLPFFFVVLNLIRILLQNLLSVVNNMN